MNIEKILENIKSVAKDAGPGYGQGPDPNILDPTGSSHN